MRTFTATLFMLSAIFATFVSFVATKEAQWVWEQTQSLFVFNFLLVGPLWFIAVCLCMRPTKRAIFAGVAVSLGVATGMSLFQVTLYRAQIVSCRPMICANRMKQIGLALKQYEKRYGCFPPAYVPDAKGKPMHSWRVLLLPFLELDVGQKYSFDEPWNGPNNRKLIDTIGKVYHCPTDSGKCDNTSYVAVVGPGTAWPGTSSTRTSDMRDGPDKTIWIVEVADSGINWMEPRDLSFDQMDFHVNGKPHSSISSCHTRRAYVLMADCRVQSLPNTLPPETVRALLTIAGGEVIPMGVLD